MSVSMRSLLLVASILASPAHAERVLGDCANGVCRVTLTPEQLTRKASQLVMEHRFDEARPMIAALGAVPSLATQTHFLTGYMAIESGDTVGAVREFRAALANSPGETRIRLELARALMMQGKRAAADYHFRLAQQDHRLPPEIQATIRASRGLLRDGRKWHLSMDVGIAPDTNITNGTQAETVDLIYGSQRVPLTLSGNARARSGIGQTGTVSAGTRIAIGETTAFLVDVDGQGVNYEGTASDDYTGQIATGPEFRLSDVTTVSTQAIASQRWYGGQRAATQFGGRTSIQRSFETGQRAGLSVDIRHTSSGFSRDYSGWSGGAYLSYERVVARTMIASATLFTRGDRLNSKAYSSTELGGNLGVGGELPHGINIGLSGGVSRSVYGAPLLGFSSVPRKDWRYTARLYAGLRSVRVAGLSPSMTVNYSRNASSMTLYDTDRLRFAFNLAKYF